ncbi:MAG: hypothetical protein IT302_08040 [Dehalococcoidia bacterium]|nr:hypothetical protein [Dehalococcoidia bacterium]
MMSSAEMAYGGDGITYPDAIASARLPASVAWLCLVASVVCVAAGTILGGRWAANFQSEYGDFRATVRDYYEGGNDLRGSGLFARVTFGIYRTEDDESIESVAYGYSARQATLAVAALWGVLSVAVVAALWLLYLAVWVWRREGRKSWWMRAYLTENNLWHRKTGTHGRNKLRAVAVMAVPVAAGLATGIYFAAWTGSQGVNFSEAITAWNDGSFEEQFVRSRSDQEYLDTTHIRAFAWIEEHTFTFPESDAEAGPPIFGWLIGAFWAAVLFVPAVGVGWFLHWWDDQRMATASPLVKLMSWAISLPGLVVLLAVAAATAALLLIVIGAIVLGILALFALGAAADAEFGASSGSGGRAIAVDRAGVRYRKNWKGEYEPATGIFGQQLRDTTITGAPKVKQGWTGPVEKRDGWSNAPQRGNDGHKLYERDE